jgi:6,7-dimethyl-8-ribityllumazine synthase
MASQLKNLSQYNHDEVPSAQEMRFGIVVSSYHADITLKLLEGCIETLTQQGASEKNIEIIFVPGAYEIPFGAKIMAEKHKLDAIICLGCVIKGETDHDQYINHAVAQGIMRLSLEINLPVIFGVLTPHNQKQAAARAGGKYGNKGVEAAIAAIKMAALKRQ